MCCKISNTWLFSRTSNLKMFVLENFKSLKKYQVLENFKYLIFRYVLENFKSFNNI